MEAFRLMPRHRTTSRRSWPTPTATGARPLHPPPQRPTQQHDSRTRPRNPHMKTTGTPAAEWPPGGAGSTTSTASPRRAPTDFGALLDQHQARTAVAEGPKKTEAPKREHHKLEREAPTRERREVRDDRHAAPAQPQADAKKADAPAEGQAPAAAAQQQSQADAEQQPTVEAPVVVV